MPLVIQKGGRGLRGALPRSVREAGSYWRPVASRAVYCPTRIGCNRRGRGISGNVPQIPSPNPIPRAARPPRQPGRGRRRINSGGNRCLPAMPPAITPRNSVAAPMQVSRPEMLSVITNAAGKAPAKRRWRSEGTKRRRFFPESSCGLNSFWRDEDKESKKRYRNPAACRSQCHGSRSFRKVSLFRQDQLDEPRGLQFRVSLILRLYIIIA